METTKTWLAIIALVASSIVAQAQDALPDKPQPQPVLSNVPRPLSETAEVHGGVTCGPSLDSTMECGVAPVFGKCPDDYDLIEYTTVRADLPATCWPHEEVVRNSGTGNITVSGASFFSRIETSTANPATIGSLKIARSQRKRSTKWVVLTVAASVAVGLTFALIERRGHCPGEYTSGDPPCPPPDKDFKLHH